MKMIPTPNSTMRHIILPILAAGVVAGVADAASGVRVHRIGDPPLPPRYLDTKTSSQYKKRPATPERLAKPVPAPPSTAVADPTAHAKSLPLAPEGFKPAEAKPAPTTVTRRLPLAPEHARTHVAPPAPAPVAPVAVPAPAPKPVVVTPASGTRPALTPPPVSKPMLPEAAPAVKPAAAPAPAPVVKPRRRLPIAPVSVADGSTELPPVPSALITR